MAEPSESSNSRKGILELSCVYSGVFASSGPLSQDEIDSMAERTTTVLLWPYLRAGVAEIARMTGVPIPQIPTLDVAGFLADSQKMPIQPATRSRAKPAASKSLTQAIRTK